MLDIIFSKNMEIFFRFCIPIFFSSLSIQYLYSTIFQGNLNKKLVIILYSILLLSFFYLFLSIAREYNRFPVGNFSEAVFFALLIITISTGLLEWTLKDRSFSFIILPLETIISIIAVFLLDSKKSIPATHYSFHWPLHIAFTIGAYVLFFIAFISALGYIFKYNEIKKRINFFLLNNLPSLEKIDRYMTWTSTTGIISLTLGMGIGLFWMIQSGYEKKEILFIKITLSAIIWLTFSLYIVMKKRWNLYGKKGAYFIFVGFFWIILAFSVGNHGF